ncbi:NUDIX hydrolase [Aeromonas phage ST4]|nr:NUDIX hydrolase [Aeromonas phage ST4]
MDLMKAHVKGYSRKDGTYVPPHERKDGPGAAPRAPAVHHPRLSHNGSPVQIKNPTHPSSHTTWHNPNAVATFVPDGDVPMSINGVMLRQWKDHPRTPEGWEFCDGINHSLYEPPFHLVPGKHAGAGVVIVEPDGRVWLTHPSNSFGGYNATWPKGSVDPGESMQAAACRETFEETGLQVEIIGHLGDFEKTTSVARMYLAKRVGGDPSRMGWESQAMSLCPVDKLKDLLNMPNDHQIVDKIASSNAPDKKE